MAAFSAADASALASIPLVDVGRAGPVALIAAAPEQFDGIMAAGRRHYGDIVLRLGDGASRRWLVRGENPYFGEIAAAAAEVGHAGGFMLNLSYEWSCTAGVGPDPSGVGSRLLRTLDWPLPGLGRYAVVARHEGNAGPYYNITWPGFVGVVTAMAPGRFSASLNQPPMRWLTPLSLFDWVIGRRRTWRSRALPPVHLLRRIFDECRTYAEAREMLSETPLCLPALLALGGIAADEGCVIERLEDQATVHDGPASITNHWLTFDVPGRPRGTDSPGRKRMMDGLRDHAGDDFAWVAPPILNETTRVSVIANAATEHLVVQGWEMERPVTDVFRL